MVCPAIFSGASTRSRGPWCRRPCASGHIFSTSMIWLRPMPLDIGVVLTGRGMGTLVSGTPRHPSGASAAGGGSGGIDRTGPYGGSSPMSALDVSDLLLVMSGRVAAQPARDRRWTGAKSMRPPPHLALSARKRGVLTLRRLQIAVRPGRRQNRVSTAGLPEPAGRDRRRPRTP